MKVKYYNYANKVFMQPGVKQAAEMIRAAMPVDRIGNGNILDLHFSPIPKFTADAMTFEQCCLEAAEGLWELDCNIRVMWSGGIDSTAVYYALWTTKPTNRELHVVLIQESIDEAPETYQHICFQNPHTYLLTYEEMMSEKFCQWDGLTITGEAGDMLFGCGALLKPYFNNYLDPWETLVDWSYEKMFPRQDDSTGHPGFESSNKRRDNLFEFIFEHVDTAPFEIVTMIDLWWWINFSIGWDNTHHRFPIRNCRSIHWQNFVAFFDTEEFQKWAIENNHHNIGGTWKTYKWPAKEFIYKHNGDLDYLHNKTKEKSLKFIYEGKNGISTVQTRALERREGTQIELLLMDGTVWYVKDNISQEEIRKHSHDDAYRTVL